MRATERLYLTAARDACVPEGSKDAAFLWAAPGDEVPDEAAARFGLVDGALPKAGAKSRKPAEDKERRAEGEDKARQAKEPGQPRAGDGGGLKIKTARKKE